MKLYTKEMFLEASKECEVSMIDAEHIMKHIDEYVTPIELPSDDEIEERIKNFIRYDDIFFKAGVNWVLEQIKQQAK